MYDIEVTIVEKRNMRAAIRKSVVGASCISPIAVKQVIVNNQSVQCFVYPTVGAPPVELRRPKYLARHTGAL